MERVERGVRRIGALGFATAAALLVACGGGGGGSPTGPPPLIIQPASVTLTSADPPDGANLVKGRRQRFVFRFHYTSRTDSMTPPFFLVGHLRQLQGTTVVDEPQDFHFPTPTLNGDVEAVIERDLRRDADSVTISWVLAAQDPPIPASGPLFTYVLVN